MDVSSLTAKKPSGKPAVPKFHCKICKKAKLYVRSQHVYGVKGGKTSHPEFINATGTEYKQHFLQCPKTKDKLALCDMCNSGE